MRDLPIFTVIANCQKRTKGHLHEPFCFEIFRRAIQEEDEACWCAIMDQYYKLVLHWVYKLEPQYAEILSHDLESVDIVQMVFLKFREVYTIDKLEQATDISSILSYLKAIVVTTFLGYMRKSKAHQNTLSYDDNILPNSADAKQYRQVDEQLIIHDIWQIIEVTCETEQDVVIADAYLRRDLKPRHILDAYEHLFIDIDEINKIKRNLWARLRRNPKLISMCKKL